MIATQEKRTTRRVRKCQYTALPSPSSPLPHPAIMHGSISGSLLIRRVKSSVIFRYWLISFFSRVVYFLHPRDRAARKSRRKSKLSLTSGGTSGVLSRFFLPLFARRNRRRARSMNKRSIPPRFDARARISTRERRRSRACADRLIA